MSMDLQSQEFKDRRDAQQERLIEKILESNFTIDSRVFAKWINKDHHAVVQGINRSRARLEQKTVLARREHKPEGRSGGRPEVYYQLTDRQSLILLSVLSTGDHRDYLYDLLVDAFLSARDRLFELEHKKRTALAINNMGDFELLLEEKLEERMQELNERFDALERKVEENSPKTILKHSFGKAKLSDLK